MSPKTARLAMIFSNATRPSAAFLCMQVLHASPHTHPHQACSSCLTNIGCRHIDSCWCDLQGVMVWTQGHWLLCARGTVIAASQIRPNVAQESYECAWSSHLLRQIAAHFTDIAEMRLLSVRQGQLPHEAHQQAVPCAKHHTNVASHAGDRVQCVFFDIFFILILITHQLCKHQVGAILCVP